MTPFEPGSSASVPVSRTLVLLGFDAVTAEDLRWHVEEYQVVTTKSAATAVFESRTRGAATLVDITRGMAPMHSLVQESQKDGGVVPAFFTVGGRPDAETMPTRIRPLGHLSLPIDFSYLRGLLDYHFRSDETNRRRLARANQRIQGMYELASSLLKSSGRAALQQALGNSLPKVLEASYIVVCEPSAKVPLLFVHASHPIGPKGISALHHHLSEACGNLLPNSVDLDWDWLALLPSAPSPEDAMITPASYVSVPISDGSRTLGFLTMLPPAGWERSEERMQGLLIAGDLLAVVLRNFELTDQLESRATHDGLTGLLNRQALIDRIASECARSRRYHHPLAIAILDIDHFKSINDNHLHHTGDEALRRLAKSLLRSVREADSVGRLGGEEFAVMMPLTTMEGAIRTAERLRHDVAGIRVPIEGGKTISFTASFGVAGGIGEGLDADELLRRADAALYEAKNSGRNRVVAAGESLQTDEVHVDSP